MPASRRARAMTLAPRSCPSSPGLAMTMRNRSAMTASVLPPFAGLAAAWVDHHDRIGQFSPISAGAHMTHASDEGAGDDRQGSGSAGAAGDFRPSAQVPPPPTYPVPPAHQIRPAQPYPPQHAEPPTPGFAAPAPPPPPAPRPEDLLLPDRSPVNAEPATWGWRGRMNRVSGGLIKARAA